MKNPEIIFKILQKIKLNAEDKSAMRFRLVSEIESKLRKTGEVPQISPFRLSPFSFPRFAFGKRALTLAVIVLLVGSSGVSLAAGNTLPGDLLYPVKIHVTEEIQGALLVGSGAKVEWEKDRIVKRVVETEELIKTKSYSPERKAKATKALKKQIEKFSEVVTEEKKTNPVVVIDVASDLEPTLRAHQEEMASLSSSSPEISTVELIQTIEVGIKAVSDQETSALSSAENSISTLELSSVVDDKITAVQKEIDLLVALDASQTQTDKKTDVSTVTESLDTSINTTNTATVSTDTNTTVNTPNIESEAQNKSEKEDTVLEEKTGLSVEEKTGLSVSQTTEQIESQISSNKSISLVSPVLNINADNSTEEKSTISPVATTETTKGLAVLKLDATIEPTEKSLERKQVISKAVELLNEAKQKKASGELSEALRLAQQAYKILIGASVSTQLSNTASTNQESSPVINTTPTSQSNENIKDSSNLAGIVINSNNVSETEANRNENKNEKENIDEERVDTSVTTNISVGGTISIPIQ